MEIIDQNELIKNKEDEEMNNFTHYKISQKIKANKWKAIGIGISLILFCLIAVLFFRDSDKKKDTSLEKEKSLEISSSSSYLNDPYFKKYSEIFPFALRTSKEGQIEIENSMFEEISEDKLSFKKETSLNSHKTEVDEESKSSYNSDFSISIDISIYCDAKFKRKVQESKEHSNKIYLIGAKSNVCSLSVF